MTCKCMDAVKIAESERQAPKYEVAFPDYEPSPEKAFLAGVRTGLLWGSVRARKTGHVAYGQRLPGVIGSPALTEMAEQAGNAEASVVTRVKEEVGVGSAG